MRQSFTWLITDTHFFHDKIVPLTGRPVDHVERTMAQLKRLVAPQDVLIHLGDVIFYQHDKLKGMLGSIPGRKILTMGNHDRKSVSWYRNNGFDFVVDTFSLGDVVFSHHPQHHLPPGFVNIHGHWHNSPTPHHERPVWYSDATHHLLSLEREKYVPVRLELWRAAYTPPPQSPAPGLA